MIHYSKKSIEQKIEEAKELICNSHNKEEKLILQNYLGNLYRALFELEHISYQFDFSDYLGEK